MRALLLTLVALAALAGCPAQAGFGNEKQGDGSGSGSGANVPAECGSDPDCTAVGAKCCDCPTFAVPQGDPSHAACTDVPCDPAPSCPNNVKAVCDTGLCKLVCAPMACATSCADGFAMDADGCLSCTCAAEGAAPMCTSDGDCVRTRADCCGCMRGGADTAVPAADQGAFDLGLMCPADPACPSVDTCTPGAVPRCIQGSCVLTTATPAGACGTPDLPACPAGQVCTINANDAATMQGLGVCLPPT